MALYNVERPMTFDELLGQDKNVKIFRQILKSENLPNAFLFIGVRGTGKTSSARLFERALNCEHPREDGSPCNECASCKEILAGTSMDVIELDAASHGGVDDVHEVLKMIQYTPIHKKKILVLDEVHMLSNAAFNALLKTIEEPPQDVIFIFCTTEEHKVPATIVSRCRRFVFERISDDVIEGKLREISNKNGVKAEDEALSIIARAAKGGMRDALSIYEQFMNADITTEVVKETLGIADEDSIFKILSAIATGKVVEAVSVLRELVKKGKNLEVLLKALIDGLIDAVYTMQSGEKVNNTQLYLQGVETYITAVGGNIGKSLSFVDQFSKVYEVSRKDSDMSYVLEMTLMKMVDYTSEIEDLKARLKSLEEQIANGISVTVPTCSEPCPSEDEYYASLCPVDETETQFEGINMPVEVSDVPFDEEVKVESTQPQKVEMAEETKEEEIPLSNDIFNMDGFEKGESISLSSLLSAESTETPVEETQPTVVEQVPANPVTEEKAEEESQEEEPDMFSDFFELGNARQF